MKNVNQLKTIFIAGISGIALVFVLLMTPFGQDPKFHLFADGREIFSIPNFWNVVSNLPFLLIGIAGMYYTFKKPKEMRTAYFVFFLGIFFTGIGSSYYHLNPNNETLVWDRLPMTISFMSFFAIIIGEYINSRVGKWIIWPFLIIGIASVFYWSYSEQQGHGDLRLYILVQFLPMILIPLIVLFYKTNSNISKYVWLVLLVYVIAKVFEAVDHPVFNCGQILSGHTIKHFFAALAPWIFLMGIAKK